MLNHKSRHRVLFCAVLSVLSSAQAKLVPVAITGTVTDVQEMMRPVPDYIHPPPPEWNPNPLDGNVKIGDTIAGVFMYDSSTPNTHEDLVYSSRQPSAADRGLYEYDAPPYGITLGAGELVFTTDPAHVDFSISIEDNSTPPTRRPGSPGPTIDRFDLESEVNLPLHDGRLVEAIKLNAWGDGNLLPSAGLPATFFPPADEWGHFSIYIKGINETGGSFHIGGHVTSVAIIPEPSTLVLLCIGGLVIPAKHRTQRKYDKYGEDR